MCSTKSIPLFALLLPISFVFCQQIVPSPGFGPNNQQKCAANETFTTCATRCEPKCNVSPGPCLLICDPPKCQCALGYVRNQNSGKCILASDCPPPNNNNPERTYSDKVYDIKADVWSLGITLLELATGVHPFEAPSELELIAKIQKATPESILTVNVKDSANLTNELIGFIKNCLHREFNKRADYRQLLNTPFLRLYERIPVDIWLWYRRMKENQLKNAMLEIC